MSSHETHRKREVLQRNGSLHPHPERVRDILFQDLDFFDPYDLVQVKYEMLRRVQKEGWTVTRAAATFGFSRPAFYQIQAAYQQAGLSGLVPQKRGPKGAHKLCDEVMSFIDIMTEEPPLSARTLALHIKKQFGITVHPRSIERAQKRREKKQHSGL